MGAPKQKWTAEEEAALKAGVVKYGAGKWRTILTDPDFSTILRMRSNVDLKVSLFKVLADYYRKCYKVRFIATVYCAVRNKKYMRSSLL
jgi:hypothetical protein